MYWALPVKRHLVCIALLTFFANPTFVRGQSSDACYEGKPFTAVMVKQIIIEQPNGTESRVDSERLLARDSSGRTYSLDVSAFKTETKSFMDGALNPGSTSATYSMILVSNCRTGEDITMFPELKTFRVVNNPGAFAVRRKIAASLFAFLTSGPHRSDATVEDLGFKEIGGVLTHGYRETIIGTEDDGEWKGKTTFVMESWVSDDLAEIIQRTISNLRAKTTTTTMLTGIKREEPPETLFEIPRGYTADLPTDKKTLPASSQSNPEN